MASVNYRQDGLIVQIDGTPSSRKADDTHFWSYWHNTGSGWTYSSEGASNYSPKAGTVEGWHYINGSSRKTPPSSSGSYAALCGKLDTPKATRGSTRRHTIGQRVGRTRPRRPPDPPQLQAALRTRPRGRAPVGTAAPKSGAAAGSASGSRSASAATTAPGSTTPAGGSDAGSVVVVSGSPVADQRHVSGGSAWPTVLAVLLAALIGGGGTVTAVRRRRAVRE